MAACLAAAAGRGDEAKTTLAVIAAECAQLGTVRFLLDSGPYVIATLESMREDRAAGRWNPEWPDVPADFLDRLVNVEVAQRI